MVKTSPATKRRKADLPGGNLPKPGGIAAAKAEQMMASKILQDIQENARDLSTRADRLIRRVS
jgi:hypothetical protein